MPQICCVGMSAIKRNMLGNVDWHDKIYMSSYRVIESFVCSHKSDTFGQLTWRILSNMFSGGPPVPTHLPTCLDSPQTDTSNQPLKRPLVSVSLCFWHLVWLHDSKSLLIFVHLKKAVVGRDFRETFSPAEGPG